MTLIRTLLCAAVLLPLPALAKDYGGLKPGDTFTLKVKKVTSTKKTGYFGQETKASVPGYVPKFRKGQKIRFKIGKKGQLTAKKLKIDYAHSDNKAIEYNTYKEKNGGKKTFTKNAELTKKGKKITGGTLSFFNAKYGAGDPKFRTVIYELK